MHLPRSLRPILAAVFCLGLAGGALSIDLAVARYFHDRPFGGELGRLITVAEVFAYGLSVFLIAVTAATLDTRGIRVGGYLAASALGAGVFADALKLVVPRLRPSFTIPESVWQTFHVIPAESLTRHARQSFPSAHTATAVGLACALAVCYPRGRYLFALFALLAATQRIYSEAHYLSDVCVGAAVGFLWVAINNRWPVWRSLVAGPNANVTASP